MFISNRISEAQIAHIETQLNRLFLKIKKQTAQVQEPALQKELKSNMELLEICLGMLVDWVRQDLYATPPRIHNERGAGRKPKLTPEIRMRISELHHRGFSQAKIAAIISQEFLSISRSLAGRAIRDAKQATAESARN